MCTFEIEEVLEISREEEIACQNGDSDTCRRQEDGTAELIRKEVSRGEEVEEKKGQKGKEDRESGKSDRAKKN